MAANNTALCCAAVRVRSSFIPRRAGPRYDATLLLLTLAVCGWWCAVAASGADVTIVTMPPTTAAARSPENASSYNATSRRLVYRALLGVNVTRSVTPTTPFGMRVSFSTTGPSLSVSASMSRLPKRDTGWWLWAADAPAGFLFRYVVGSGQAAPWCTFSLSVVGALTGAYPSAALSLTAILGPSAIARCSLLPTVPVGLAQPDAVIATQDYGALWNDPLAPYTRFPYEAMGVTLSGTPPSAGGTPRGLPESDEFSVFHGTIIYGVTALLITAFGAMLWEYLRFRRREADGDEGTAVGFLPYGLCVTGMTFSTAAVVAPLLIRASVALLYAAYWRFLWRRSFDLALGVIGLAIQFAFSFLVPISVLGFYSRRVAASSELGETRMRGDAQAYGVALQDAACQWGGLRKWLFLPLSVSRIAVHSPLHAFPGVLHASAERMLHRHSSLRTAGIYLATQFLLCGGLAALEGLYSGAFGSDECQLASRIAFMIALAMGMLDAAQLFAFAAMNVAMALQGVLSATSSVLLYLSAHGYVVADEHLIVVAVWLRDLAVVVWAVNVLYSVAALLHSRSHLAPLLGVHFRGHRGVPEGGSHDGLFVSSTSTGDSVIEPRMVSIPDALALVSRTPPPPLHWQCLLPPSSGDYAFDNLSRTAAAAGGGGVHRHLHVSHNPYYMIPAPPEPVPRTVGMWRRRLVEW